MFWVDNLSPGKHNLTITHTGTQGQYLSLVFFLAVEVISGVHDDDISPDLYSPIYIDNDGESPTGAIVGGVGAGSLLIILIIALLFPYFRKHNGRSYKSEKTSRASISHIPLLPREAGESSTAPTRSTNTLIE
ncbi:hypothetical protein CPB86DRAFT_309141 [Serendipita vermifera]|nr:hypothetical protein CPB86DRAFT_309141 [Serendipita vermifera]